MLLRSLAFMDLLSLELPRVSTKVDRSIASNHNIHSNGVTRKKIKKQLSAKIVQVRLPHVLELTDGKYLLTSCELHTIHEDEVVLLPIRSLLCVPVVQHLML